MDRLASHVDPSSDEFRRNRARMAALVAELRERLAAARQGGAEKSIRRQQTQGKLPARDRIGKLPDPGSPFLELSPLAASDLHHNEAPAAGIITGVRRGSAREVGNGANDSTLKRGTSYPIT